MFAIALLALLSPVFYSYTATMLQPSSLPLWPRSVEWLRAHHGNWLVDEVEQPPDDAGRGHEDLLGHELRDDRAERGRGLRRRAATGPGS